MKTLSRCAALCWLAAAPAWPGSPFPFEHLDELTGHLLSGGPPVDGIPALTNPAFAPAPQIEYVRDTDLVIGVVRGGEVKAYPENLGWWHEIINDRIGGGFVSVTLCPLTGTPQVFDATDSDGSQIEFGVSGLLINSNLVMYDRRDDTTLYPQMIYTGISGEYKGEQLELLPAIVTTFEMWKRMYPESEVALWGTGLDRYPAGQQSRYSRASLYGDYPYGDYRTNHDRLFFPWTTDTPDLSVYRTKEMVLGICLADRLRAYAFRDMGPEAVINDDLGGEPLLVVFHEDSHTALPYSRRVDERTLTFYQAEPSGPLPEFRDVETGTTWDLLGRGLEGPLEGEQLAQLPAYYSMWFAWSTWWPESTVWQAGDGIIDEPEDTAVLMPEADSVPRGFELEPELPQPLQRGDAHPLRPARGRRRLPHRVQRLRPAGALPGRRPPPRRPLPGRLGRYRRVRPRRGQRCLPLPPGDAGPGPVPAADHDPDAVSGPPPCRP